MAGWLACAQVQIGAGSRLVLGCMAAGLRTWVRLNCFWMARTAPGLSPTRVRASERWATNRRRRPSRPRARAPTRKAPSRA